MLRARILARTLKLGFVNSERGEREHRWLVYFCQSITLRAYVIADFR